MKYDTIVLGAGMVGVSCALHLQSLRGSVALLDRRQPGLETSFGNSGIIQREAVEPYELPRNWFFLASGAFNRRIDVRYHPSALARLAGPLWSYFRNSHENVHRAIAKDYETIIALSVQTHEELMAQAGATSLVSARGYLTLFRTRKELRNFFALADERRSLGVNHLKLDAADLAEAEPWIARSFCGAVKWTDPLAISSPGDLVQAYARLFEERGGHVALGDAMSLRRSGKGWQVDLADGECLEAGEVVVALGPWSVNLTSRFGYSPPMFPKRGYHMHYAPMHGRPLNHWVIDAENGFVVCPMKDGLRLTTGAELAMVDSPATPRQLEAAEPIARQAFPMGQRLQQVPWMGVRPCMPDMKPVFGAVPNVKGMWCAFGHGHQGFTLGPVTGELLAAQMNGTQPRVDVLPFSPARFV